MSGNSTNLAPARLPDHLTGGCLCGNTRYSITPSKDHNWTTGPQTCQCTQCRKHSGSLVLNFHTFSGVEFSWTSKSTLADYTSSPGCHRYFCSTCGSSLGWQKDPPEPGEQAEIDVFSGSIDEVYLIGDRKSDEGYGVALAGPGDGFFVENKIKGVTDKHPHARRFLRGRADGAQ